MAYKGEKAAIQASRRWHVVRTHACLAEHLLPPRRLLRTLSRRDLRPLRPGGQDRHSPQPHPHCPVIAPMAGSALAMSATAGPKPQAASVTMAGTMDNRTPQPTWQFALPWAELDVFTRGPVPATLQPTATVLAHLEDRFRPALLRTRLGPEGAYAAVWPADRPLPSTLGTRNGRWRTCETLSSHRSTP